MTHRHRTLLIVLAAGGSAMLLLGAFGFQYLGGLPPCKMCLWQRWPHAAAVLVGVVALWTRGPQMPLLGMLAALTTAGIGGFHAGVEQGWWQGPSTCSAAQPGSLSADQLFDQIMAAPLIRCDTIPWQMLGLSMAAWNMVISLALALLWLGAATRRP